MFISNMQISQFTHITCLQLSFDIGSNTNRINHMLFVKLPQQELVVSHD